MLTFKLFVDVERKFVDVESIFVDVESIVVGVALKFNSVEFCYKRTTIVFILFNSFEYCLFKRNTQQMPV